MWILRTNLHLNCIVRPPNFSSFWDPTGTFVVTFCSHFVVQCVDQSRQVFLDTILGYKRVKSDYKKRCCIRMTSPSEWKAAKNRGFTGPKVTNFVVNGTNFQRRFYFWLCDLTTALYLSSSFKKSIQKKDDNIFKKGKLTKIVTFFNRSCWLNSPWHMPHFSFDQCFALTELYWPNRVSPKKSCWYVKNRKKSVLKNLEISAKAKGLKWFKILPWPTYQKCPLGCLWLSMNMFKTEHPIYSSSL